MNLSTSITILFLIFLGIRLISLFKSVRNEKNLKKNGALEYGKKVSMILTFSHILFYLSVLIEALLVKPEFNLYSYIGIGIFAFSMLMLWIVIYSLKEVWTVKLYIAKDHKVNKNFIFKYVRHPNYYLNVIPELIGIALTFQAWFTLAIGLPLYLIPLIIRIGQEENIMKEKLPEFL